MIAKKGRYKHGGKMRLKKYNKGGKSRQIAGVNPQDTQFFEGQRGYAGQANVAPGYQGTGSAVEYITLPDGTKHAYVPLPEAEVQGNFVPSSETERRIAANQGVQSALAYRRGVGAGKGDLGYSIDRAGQKGRQFLGAAVTDPNLAMDMAQLGLAGAALSEAPVVSQAAGLLNTGIYGARALGKAIKGDKTGALMYGGLTGASLLGTAPVLGAGADAGTVATMSARVGQGLRASQNALKSTQAGKLLTTKVPIPATGGRQLAVKSIAKGGSNVDKAYNVSTGGAEARKTLMMEQGGVMKNVKKKTAEDMFAKGGRTQKMPKMKMGVHKSREGGLTAKGVAAYRRANPGSKLKTAVTTKPSKLKPGSKAAKRRKSFCARMSGMPGPMKKPNGKPTRKALALRKWNC